MEAVAVEAHEEVKELNTMVDPDLIQIKAQSETEIRRRIDAFMQSKRIEVNERNIREFISPSSSDACESCARVEAVYVHREGGRSHVTLKKVNNLTGPQTQIPTATQSSTARVALSAQRREAVEERLANMETHLALEADGQDVYARIRSLEKRIGFLEGLSPEYTIKGKNPNPKSDQTKKIEHVQRPSSIAQPQSLSDIDKRIKFLKDVLRQKSR